MDIKSYIEEKGKKAREGARRLATLSTAVKNNALIAMAEAIELDADRLKRENRKDIEAGKARSLSSAMIDRLTLNDKRIKEMSRPPHSSSRAPSALPAAGPSCPLPNGMQVGKI